MTSEDHAVMVMPSTAEAEHEFLTHETKDTITTLLKNIKARMAENPALAQNP